MLPFREERRAGVGYALHAAFRHLEEPQLIRGTIAVLDRSQEAVLAPPIPFEPKNSVHHVLKQPGARHDAFFGHMPDEDCGHSEVLGKAEQPPRAVADLAYTPRRRRNIRGAHSLNGVDDQELGRGLLDLLCNCLDVIVGQQQKVVAGRLQSPGPECDL